MEEYSASATIVPFDRPIPLLRGPIPAGGSESGQYVLAFRSLDSWAAAYKRCETLIKEQCEEGAKTGCAVSASNNCKPPWWRRLGGGAVVDMRERDKCEEREFNECLGVAKDKCSGFAKEKCSAAFLDARIAVATEIEGLVWLASVPEDSKWLGSLVHARRKTNRRARDVLKSKKT
ncbi:unnamed protein product [Eruca vesicaria subsp. sativa]|uniref:Uncharacterized protein n=1 Tax=Eruca vesicaria subsp. sativa TaxID=29727 RepID=A0ABC8LQV8_ERUVS|nr:unnamed protein product [Eruca vesicaria subsp. sativa]